MLIAVLRCTSCRRRIYHDPLDARWYHLDHTFDMEDLPHYHEIGLPPEAAAPSSETPAPNWRRLMEARADKATAKPYDWAADEKKEVR